MGEECWKKEKCKLLLYLSIPKEKESIKAMAMVTMITKPHLDLLLLMKMVMMVTKKMKILQKSHHSKEIKHQPPHSPRPGNQQGPPEHGGTQQNCPPSPRNLELFCSLCDKNSYSRILSSLCIRISKGEWEKGRITRIQWHSGSKWSIYASCKFFSTIENSLLGSSKNLLN